MDITTLEKANQLNRKIKEFTEALNCFEWQVDEGQPKISTNPRLIVEFDGDGREQLMIPMALNKTLVDFLKNEIIEGRNTAVSEFNDL